MRNMNVTVSLCHRFRRRWTGKGGYREFLVVAVPLILSTGAWSIQHFVNRMFLTWYSPEAVAAAMPAGMLNFVVMSLFLGMVSYVDVFIAQYYGAKRYAMIGPSLWQGIYLSLVGALVLVGLVPLAPAVFRFIGHAPEIRGNEVMYFQTLCFGAFPALASAVISGFYAGRGKTWTLVLVNMSGTAVNIVLDYLLIFGNNGLPRLGIQGAGIATVISAAFTFLLYLVLISKEGYDVQYHTVKGWRLHPSLLKRIIRFGLPSGVHFFLDMTGFTAFVLIMGSLGTIPLAATNIAFNISTLAFMPMLGSGIAVSVMVGQYLGKNSARAAERSVFSGFHLTFSYIFLVSALYVAAPGIFTAPYAANADPARFAQIKDIVVILLRFVAVYSLFDAMNIVFASALKGAGDTPFIMRMIIGYSLFALVIPAYVALEVFHRGIYTGWTIVS
ncbi:MAG: MATE family efflux transporter, partial [Endomicrobiales bacterium]